MTLTGNVTRLRAQLASPASSARLQAVLAAGTYPDNDYVDVLVEQCTVEPDFYVRDMLTWSLTRHSTTLTVPRLLAELHNDVPQARSQALHTLSKIAEPSTWSAITADLIHDLDDEVARSAWRAAVILVPHGSGPELARMLTTQLGRGDRDTHLSLSRALAALGENARPAVDEATVRGNKKARLHALATLRILDDPDESFDAAIFDAQRIMALGTDADR